MDAILVVPRTLLGLDAALIGEPLGLEVAVVGFLRGRSFTLSGRPVAEALASAPTLRATRAPKDGEPPFAGAPAPASPESAR
ncbi:MAG TPA: hypothetical protein PKW35_11360, partial [Nannocystaceae bacterium]|nr:hypothetical protein [Nannocystaceae bacterium]